MQLLLAKHGKLTFITRNECQSISQGPLGESVKYGLIWRAKRWVQTSGVKKYAMLVPSLFNTWARLLLSCGSFISAVTTHLKQTCQTLITFWAAKATKTVCHGYRLIKQVDYFWVDFDHF
jgi:hypothetical protein